jgi:putative ABC transport system permease protein
VILLVGAALFIGSFVKLMRVDPGFEPDRVVTAFVAPPTTPRIFFARIIERLEETPGVVSAAVVAGGTPLGPIAFGGSLRISPAASEEDSVPARYKIVTADYHRVMAIPLRSGRLFEPTDREGTANVILISEKASSTYFADGDPVGRVVDFNGFERTIIGVVGDVRDRGLEAEIEPTVYMPMAQNFQPTGELVVRTSGSQEALPAIRAVLLDVMPAVPVRNIQTMEDVFAQHTAQRRVNMLLLGLFGVLGLAISAVGIYGVLAVVVSQRTREIGVRMALGATRANVVRMVLAKTGALVACGLIIGGVGAWYLSATARAFLFGVEPTDPRAFAAAIVTLLLAALAASLIPARRAASVDPVVALRAE